MSTNPTAEIRRENGICIDSEEFEVPLREFSLPTQLARRRLREAAIVKFLVQLQLKAGGQNAAIEAFEQRGPNRTLGVSLQHAWIDTQAHVVFVLAEASDWSLIEKAAEAWAEFGQFTIHPVIDIEQF